MRCSPRWHQNRPTPAVGLGVVIAVSACSTLLPSAGQDKSGLVVGAAAAVEDASAARAAAPASGPCPAPTVRL
jgi:hypothetical protein